MKFQSAFFFFLLVASTSCNTGLGPITEPTAIRGVIRFKNWPTTTDSLRDLRLVLFEKYPADSVSLIASLIAGTVAVFPKESGFQSYVDTVEYEFTPSNGLTPLKIQTYEYVIVAQQYGANIFNDWRPAGVYPLRPNSFDPAPVFVRQNRTLPNIDITVDFSNAPSWPWRQ